MEDDIFFETGEIKKSKKEQNNYSNDCEIVEITDKIGKKTLEKNLCSINIKIYSLIFNFIFKFLLKFFSILIILSNFKFNFFILNKLSFDLKENTLIMSLLDILKTSTNWKIVLSICFTICFIYFFHKHYQDKSINK